MNKSLEKICEEKSYKYGKEKFNQAQIRLPTWPHDYAQGFKDAISTLRCENCKHADPCINVTNLFCYSVGFVDKDFGCVEFEPKERGE